MAEKLLIGIGVAVMLAGCAQFAEMEETRVAGNAYLTGKFNEQISELEALAAKSPDLGYSTARIVQEILPPKGSGTAWVARTKYAKVAYPVTKEEFNAWRNAIDGNIAKLKDKINAETEEAKRKEVDRIAKEKAAAEEARRKEEERIAKEKAAAEEGIPQDFIWRGKVCLATDRGNMWCVPDELQPGDFEQTTQKNGLGIGILKATPQWIARRNEKESNEAAVKEKAAEEARRKEEERIAKEIAEVKSTLNDEELVFIGKLDRELQIIVTKQLADVKTEIPSVVNRMAEELQPVLSAINSNQLLSVDLELCAALRETSNKYYYKFYQDKNFSVLQDWNAGKEFQRFSSDITNLYFNVDGKAFGPIFSAHNDNGDMRVTFNGEIFSDVLSKRFMREIAEQHYMCPNPDSIKSGLETFRKKNSNMDIAHAFMRVDDGLCLIYECSGNEHGTREKYKLNSLIKFANEYAMAKSIIDKEEVKEKERVAALKRLAEEYVNMPESEKFPLLSVQPKPQMLMKDIYSGVPINWVQGWLLANKIEHDEPWIDKSNGNATIDGRFYNKDGIKVRTVKFRFCDDALVTLSIRLEEKPTTPDDVEKKYLKEFGSTAKAERRKGDLKLYSHQDNTMTWTRDDLIKVTTDDVGAVAMYKTFAGLVMISESTAQGLVFAGTEEKMRYMLFDKTSRADLVINADGSVIRCTKDGEILKAYAKDLLPSSAQEIDNRITEIEVWDMKLYNYMTEKEKKAKEAAARKAAEEAKKAKADAALDF